MTHLSDLEVKVMGQILTDVVAKHKSGELRCPATALIINPAPGDKNGPALGVISSHNIKHNGKNIKKSSSPKPHGPELSYFVSSNV